ncbi:MAG: hypothetical protein M1830_009645 [Pleopsidium flavum]|nr:MAG: hypothetical protein M1830_009645 [Pleopsidium flavum]
MLKGRYRDWYCSAQSIRSRDSQDSDDFYPRNAIIEEGSEEEHENSSSSPTSESKFSPSSKHPRPHRQGSTARDAATSELRKHELLALLACFIFPIMGAWLLHAIRSKLSRPSEGLVSNYNLTVFLLASELRPLIHLVKLGQSRTLHLQRIANTSPYEEDKVDKEKVLDLSKRLEELEAHVAQASTETGVNGSSNKNTVQATTEARRALQPDLDALNRAVRRYEKRATILTMQTESRLQDLESRMNDAISLAAAAERSNQSQRQSFAAILIDWLCAAMVLPIQALWECVSLPARIAAQVLTVTKGYVGGKVQKEMKTAGRHSEPGRMAGSRNQGRAMKKAT